MYTIGQVSERFDLPVSTLRYYDKEGLFPALTRTSGIRRFGEQELEALRVIECLKRSGLEIKEIKQFMEWCAQGSETYPQRHALFVQQAERVEAEIARLQKSLDMIRSNAGTMSRPCATAARTACTPCCRIICRRTSSRFMTTRTKRNPTILIQKGWRPMKQRTILSTLLFCALLLAGCGTAAQTPDATPTPAQEAAATPTPTPDPLSTLPYTDGQLYAAAYLGYQAPTDLDFFQQTYFGGRELPVHHISDGDFYLIIPRDPNATVRLYKNDMVTDSKTLFYEQTNGDAFVIGCNVSDIFPDVTVSITSGGETVDFSPYISLKDGSVQVGARGLNITRISTSS